MSEVPSIELPKGEYDEVGLSVDAAFDELAAGDPNLAATIRLGGDQERQYPFGVVQFMVEVEETLPRAAVWTSSTGSRTVGKADVPTDTQTDTDGK